MAAFITTPTLIVVVEAVDVYSPPHTHGSSEAERPEVQSHGEF